KDWAADIEAELIKTERLRTPGQTWIAGMVTGPGIGVQRGVPEILNEITVERPGAALGDESDLTSRRSSVLGVEVRGKDLDLFHGIDVLRAQHGTGRTRASRHSAIHHNDVLVGACAVDAEAAIADTIRVEGPDRAADDTRLEQCQVNRITA